MKLEAFLWGRAAALAVLFAVAGVVALPSAPAHAETFKFNVSLDQAQAASTCPAGMGSGTGTGTGSVTYDTASNMLSWTITFSGMSGAPTSAHFHGPALPGMDAGIQVAIGDLTSPSVGSASITEAQEGQLLTSMWYINYHTSACSGGEIRGQVSGSGVGGVAGAPELDRSPLASQHGSSRDNTGMIAAIGGGIALAVVTAGGATLAWRRRVR